MFKKTAVAALAAICALCGMAFAACGTTPPEAPEEEKWFEPERYTATDYLLDAEGNPSDTSIFDLAERVNAAQAGDEIPDLSSAIPLLQLPHKYVGREYGYAVEKDGDIFSVMLFDIDFDCSKTRRGELTLTVLFNRRFRREVKDGRYTWFAAEGQSVLKLANPRFSAMITYEHSPVAGTYLPESFTDDEMLHIYQSWVKYDGAEYLERGEPRKYFAGSALVAACAENAEYIAMGEEYTVTGIFNNRKYDSSVRWYTDVGSGFEQRLYNTDYGTGGYLGKVERVRVAGFAPALDNYDMDSGVFLSEADATASFSVETNAEGRLCMACEFDVLSPPGLAGRRKYAVYTLQADALSIPEEEPAIEINMYGYSYDLSTFTQRVPLYIYPRSVQKFVLHTDFGGTYSFKMDNSAYVYVEGGLTIDGAEVATENRRYAARLGAGDYEVTVYNTFYRDIRDDDIVVSYDGIDTEISPEELSQGGIEPGESRLFKMDTNGLGWQNFTYSGNARIEFVDSCFPASGEGFIHGIGPDNSRGYILFWDGRPQSESHDYCYVVFSYDGEEGTTGSASLQLSPPEELSAADENKIPPLHAVYAVTNNSSRSVTYTVTAVGGYDGLQAAVGVFDEEFDVAAEREVETGQQGEILKYTFTFTLRAGKTVYVLVESDIWLTLIVAESASA